MKNIIIVINSSNRVDKVRTHLLFPQYNVIDWVIAVPQSQIELYSDKFDSILIIPDSVAPYLPSQRQWVMEHMVDKYEFVWFMDDDLKFSFREPNSTKLTLATSTEVAGMFSAMKEAIIDYPLVGISTRLGNNFVEKSFDTICRVTRCYALSTKVFKELDIKFNPIEPFVAEDFHMTLCLLNAGHKNIVLYNYAQEDIGSNAAGGCSVYRTAKVQEDTMKWMAKNHPEVTLKVKTNKTGWNLPGSVNNERLDCIIQWKKAYKPKRTNTLKRFF